MPAVVVVSVVVRKASGVVLVGDTVGESGGRGVVVATTTTKGVLDSGMFGEHDGTSVSNPNVGSKIIT